LCSRCFKAARVRTRSFLQTFDATSSIVQDFTNDPEVLNEKILALKAGGGKALYDAVYYACKEKMLKTGPPENTRRVIVLLSNGLDVQSTHTLDEALSMARKAETRIYTIDNSAYGYTNPGDEILERLAADTGGAARFPLRQTPGTDLGTGYLSHGQIGETSQNKGLGAETGIFSAQRLVQMADSLEAIGRELKRPVHPRLHSHQIYARWHLSHDQSHGASQEPRGPLETGLLRRGGVTERGWSWHLSISRARRAWGGAETPFSANSKTSSPFSIRMSCTEGEVASGRAWREGDRVTWVRLALRALAGCPS